MSATTEPQPNTYILGVIFSMPTEDGSVPAISVEKRTGDNLISLYSVLITLLFIPAWKLVALLTGRYLHNDVEQLRRPGTSWKRGFRKVVAAFSMPWEEIEAKSANAPPGRWRNQLSLFVLALAFFLGSTIAGIFIPPLLVIGSVAPVQPAAVFFPDAEGVTPEDGWKVQALKAPAAARALGNVGAAQSQGTGVDVSQELSGVDVTAVNYKYQITGLDFGLQRQSRLVQAVEGRCVLEYGWVQAETNATAGDGNDLYYLWDLPTHVVPVSRGQTLDPPWATFHLHPNSVGMAEMEGNVSYAIVAHSAGRLSYTPSSDPWYATQQVPAGDSSTAGSPQTGVPYRVLPGRPALSCWQRDTWSFDGQTATGVFRLGELAGLDLGVDMANFLSLQFGAPKIFDIGISLGRASLLSGTTFLDRIDVTSFDAASSRMRDDLERLVWAAYVSSRDIFRESTMVVERHTIPNAVSSFVGGDADFAQFVLSTSAVSTLSLAVLVAVPVVCVCFWILHLTVAHLSTRWWGEGTKPEENDTKTPKSDENGAGTA